MNKNDPSEFSTFETNTQIDLNYWSQKNHALTISCKLETIHCPQLSKDHGEFLFSIISINYGKCVY